MKKLTLIATSVAIFVSSSVVMAGDAPILISVPAEGLSFYLIGLSAVVIALVAAKFKK